MSHWSNIIKRIFFVGVEQSVSKEYVVVGFHLGIWVGILFVLGKGEEINYFLPVSHVG